MRVCSKNMIHYFVMICFFSLSKILTQQLLPPLTITINATGGSSNVDSRNVVSLPHINTQTTDFLSTTSCLVYDHPWQVAGAVCFVTYAGSVAALYGMAYQCMYRSPWAHWKSNYNAIRLRRTGSSEQIALELFKAINIVYAHERAKGDFLTPLVCFINALDAEIQWHRRFLNLHAWLQKIYIHGFFPQQQAARLQVTEQLERLIALRDLLVTWLGSYTNEDVYEPRI